MFQSCGEIQNTQFMSDNIPPPHRHPRKSCRLRDNAEGYCSVRRATDDNITWGMRVVCWITEATDTLRVCNNYCFSTAKIITRTRLSVSVHTYITYLVDY